MNSFAAFIITYEREKVLPNTIRALLAQTCPPEKILIVDNSSSAATRLLIDNLCVEEPRLEYFHVGYNSGPAGGAYWGLKILTEQGFSLIQWIDDDNPPEFADINEQLLKLIEGKNDVGVVGKVGSRFSRITGRLKRLTDEELVGGGILDVDFIGGNQMMIINADVIRLDCLPEKDLFFGFEDLSFCLKVRAAGYKILVPSDLFLINRQFYNRLGKLNLKTPDTWRLYYSIRSLVFICLYEQKLIIPLVFIFAKVLKDSLRTGNYKFGMRGFIDGLFAKKGIIVKPLQKLH